MTNDYRERLDQAIQNALVALLKYPPSGIKVDRAYGGSCDVTFTLPDAYSAQVLGPLYAAMHAHEPPAVELTAIQREVAKLADPFPSSIEGWGGDRALFNVLNLVHKALPSASPEDLVAGLTAWNKRCSPPWQHADILRKAQIACATQKAAPEPLSDAKHTGKCVTLPAPYANYFVHYHQTGGARGEPQWQVGRYDNLNGRSFNLWNCPGSYTLEAALAFAQTCAENSEKRYGTLKAPEKPVPPPYGATCANSPRFGTRYRGFVVCGSDETSGRFYRRTTALPIGTYTVAWTGTDWSLCANCVNYPLGKGSLDEALDRAKEMMK